MIPRKFSLSDGVKRKALIAIPTICRYCGHSFYDKVYGIGRHKVICPHCHKVNATTDFPTMAEIERMGKQYDIGTMGRLGGFSRGTGIRDVKEHVERENKMSLAQYLNIIRLNNPKKKKNKDDKKERDK